MLRKLFAAFLVLLPITALAAVFQGAWYTIPYQASAVHFNNVNPASAYFSTNSLTATDSGDFSFYFRAKVNWGAGSSIFISDPASTKNLYLQGTTQEDQTQPSPVVVGAPQNWLYSPPVSTAAWHDFIGSFSGGGPAYAYNCLPMATSDDGSIMYFGTYNDGPAVGGIYKSTDHGATWVRVYNNDSDWYNIATSSNGQVVFAITRNDSLVTSTNAGATWSSFTVLAPIKDTVANSVSPDGTKFGVANGNGILVSSDGVHFTDVTPAGAPSAWWPQMYIMSNDGQNLVALNGWYSENGAVYTSSNGGSTWTKQTGAGSEQFFSITASADRSKLALASYTDRTYSTGGHIQVSSDGGVTWSIKSAFGAGPWQWVMISNDGQTIVAIGSTNFDGGYSYISTDGGTTVSQIPIGYGVWVQGTISADGSIIGITDNFASVMKITTNSGSTWNLSGTYGTTPRTGKLYVDGVPTPYLMSQQSTATFLPSSTSANGKPFYVGDALTFAAGLTGDLSDLWIAFGQTLLVNGDIPSATLAKFRNPITGAPVFLGANGQLPTGTSPTIFGSGDANTFMQPNLGTGGAFTLTGTLTNASSHP